MTKGKSKKKSKTKEFNITAFCDKDCLGGVLFACPELYSLLQSKKGNVKLKIRYANESKLDEVTRRNKI